MSTALPSLRRSASLGFLAAGVAAVGVGALAATALGLSLWAPVKGVLVVVLLAQLAWPALARHLPHTTLGPANQLTLVRSVAVALLAGFVGDSAAGDWLWLQLGLVGLVMVADGLDGMLARRSGFASEFGGALDAELDAILVLVLSMLALQSGHAGAWVLLAGAARFGWIGAGRLWPWLQGSTPPSNHRKLCFAATVWCLALTPVLGEEAGWITALNGTVLVLMSFVLDGMWLHTHRSGNPGLREDVEPDLPGDLAWTRLVQAARGTAPLVPMSHPDDQALLQLYAPLLIPLGNRPRVCAHLAQSIDGHIALHNGESRWISGPEDIRHTHRLRALCDAVLVGVQTVLADNPQLTVRAVVGDNPLRVVVDPRLRMTGDEGLCQDGAETLIFCATEHTPASGMLGGAHVVGIDSNDGRLPPAAMLDALHSRGITRLLVEGGGRTVSHFMDAGLVDHLHLVVAPVMLGDGRPALRLAPCTTMDDAPRPPHTVHQLGVDTLFNFTPSTRPTATP